MNNMTTVLVETRGLVYDGGDLWPIVDGLTTLSVDSVEAFAKVMGASPEAPEGWDYIVPDEEWGAHTLIKVVNDGDVRASLKEVTLAKAKGTFKNSPWLHRSEERRSDYVHKFAHMYGLIPEEEKEVYTSVSLLTFEEPDWDFEEVAVVIDE